MADKHLIDKLFNEAFENFGQLPPDVNWSKISGLLDSGIINNTSLESESIGLRNQEQLIDHTFQKAFRDFESLPPEHAWTAIQKQIPLNLFVKNHLTRLSKMAAILLLAFAFIFILGYVGLIDKLNQRFEKPEKPEIQLENESLAGIIPIEPTEAIPKPDNSNSHIIAENQPKDLLDISMGAGITGDKEKLIINEGIVEIPNVQHEEFKSPDPFGQGDPINSNSDLTSGQGSLNDPGNYFLEEDAINHNLSNNLGSHSYSELKVLQSFPFAGLVLPKDRGSSSKRELQSETEWAEQKLLSIFEENDYFNNPLARSIDNQRIMESMSYKGLYLSALTGINNSWIISETLRNEIGADGEAKYVLDMGTTLGAGIGYQFTPAISVEAAWIHARQGQRYQNLGSSGIYKTGDLSTIYHYFPLQIKWQAARMRNSGKMPMTWNYVLGMHYGRRNSAVLKSDEEGISLDEYLVSNELGMSLGIELRMFIDPTLFISLGGYGRAGAEANAIFGSQTYHSTNLNIGLQLGINYRLAR